MIGGFISVDPQLDGGNPAQFNAYVYAGNNPLTWSDPSGLDWFSDMVDAGKKALKGAVSAVGSFVNKYKAEIAGAVVGLVVGIGCTVATGGVGVVGCAILAGAAGGAVTSLIHSAETGKFSVQGLIVDTLVGGAIGGLTAGLGAVLGPVLKAGASAAGNAIKSAFGSMVRTVTSKFKPVLNSISQRVNSIFKPAAAIKPTGASNIAANQSAGNAARDAIAASHPGSLIEQSFSTTAGTRRIDVLTAAGEAIESKVGLTSLTTATRAQILKDTLLVGAGDIRSAAWEFTRSAVTGRIGPTGPLAEALQAAGIPWRLVP